MTQLLKAAAVTTALLFPFASAQALTVQAGYSIDANYMDPGLVIETFNVAPNPFSFDLNGAGDSYTFNLFKIWTNESDVSGADFDGKQLAVQFDFTSPDVFSGVVGGETSGETNLWWAWIVPVVDHWGQLTWDQPSVDFAFGANNDGILRVSLNNAIFNHGHYGLDEGLKHGALISATFTLVQDATAAVPEPATLALLGLGLVGLGAARRRAA